MLTDSISLYHACSEPEVDGECGVYARGRCGMFLRRVEMPAVLIDELRTRVSRQHLSGQQYGFVPDSALLRRATHMP